MDQDKQLKGASSWQYKPRQTTSCLGDELEVYLGRHARTLKKNADLVDLWESIIPPGLRAFCRLHQRSGNTLYIEAQPGPYMHQLQIMSGELLEQIRRHAPGCGIQKIKIVPEKKTNTE